LPPLVSIARCKSAAAASFLTKLMTTPQPASAVTLSDEDQHYRHRVVDFTIPLRNVLLLPKS